MSPAYGQPMQLVVDFQDTRTGSTSDWTTSFETLCSRLNGMRMLIISTLKPDADFAASNVWLCRGIEAWCISSHYLKNDQKLRMCTIDEQTWYVLDIITLHMTRDVGILSCASDQKNPMECWECELLGIASWWWGSRPPKWPSRRRLPKKISNILPGIKDRVWREFEGCDMMIFKIQCMDHNKLMMVAPPGSRVFPPTSW